MELTEWQIEKVRTALRAWRHYTPSLERHHQTWAEVAGQIEALTEVFMPAESLRQFVEGVSRRGEPERQRTLQPERLRAVVAFLTNSEIGAMTRDELDEDRFVYTAPLRLAEFLEQELDRDAPRPTSRIDGAYRAVAREAGRIVALELTLRTDAASGVIRAGLARDIYADPGNMPFESWDEAQRQRNRRSRKESAGWAVLTPEDNILIFLKDLPFPVNHYLSLAAEADLWTGLPVTRLIVLRQDYPPERDGAGQDPAAGLARIGERLAAQVTVFDRVSRQQQRVAP